jgi:hypothetical protein
MRRPARCMIPRRNVSRRSNAQKAGRFSRSKGDAEVSFASVRWPRRRATRVGLLCGLRCKQPRLTRPVFDATSLRAWGGHKRRPRYRDGLDFGVGAGSRPGIMENASSSPSRTRTIERRPSQDVATNIDDPGLAYSFLRGGDLILAGRQVCEKQRPLRNRVHEGITVHVRNLYVARCLPPLVAKVSIRS